MKDKTSYYIIAVGVTIAMLILFLAGCANVTYNPETGEIKYSRWFEQTIEGFKMDVVEPNGAEMHVEFSKQDGGAGDIAKTALNLSEVLTGVP